jgi:hypothetical protein
MILIAGYLGLRASEIVGLQCRDFDFEKSTLLVQRGIVHGGVDDVKTEYSRDVVPIAPEQAYRAGCYPTEQGWLFGNPATDRPYHQEEIQKKHIRRAAKAAGITFRVGWKTFRHSYRSWLDQTDAPIGVQRELMWKRPDVDLVLPRFIRRVRNPASVRREPWNRRRALATGEQFRFARLGTLGIGQIQRQCPEGSIYFDVRQSPAVWGERPWNQGVRARQQRLRTSPPVAADPIEAEAAQA